MNDILNNLSSVSWWFGVIFVGISVSLGASYLKPHIDVWLSNYSKSRKDKNEKVKQEWAYEVSILKTDKTYRELHISRISHARGRSIFFVLLGFLLPLLCGLTTAIGQYTLITNPGNLDQASIFYNASSETLSFFILFTLFAILSGLLTVILGLLYFKNTEKLQQQLEDSFTEAFNDANRDSNLIKKSEYRES
ncbi:hypothetical protein FQ082_05210 [Psychrobacter sp. ANT_H56B]|uniref:hypothetical protein n=1 Tax=unclassified Psychrobacter TaxID=196806 RepID=UPI000354E6E0|nr:MULTISPECIES: hypothetical protein [unclassified Psychrobacter]AGP47643.1 hypothetical protein PSYCG_00270 [Psychrobacter sp. G]KAA0927245.1 hypothetical protein FQ082_05210 [Psychrobacter sp. ANT_H56B]